MGERVEQEDSGMEVKSQENLLLKVTSGPLSPHAACCQQHLSLPSPSLEITVETNN
jgi:hypothetical protein